jgi:hypothetical protein
MYKEKATDGGKLKIGPPWDYDRAFEYWEPGRTSGWVWEITHPYWPFPFWWSKWWTEQDFRKQVACRWEMLRQTTLSNDSFNVMIDSLSAEIDEAQGRNFTVWNDLGGQTYQDQIDSLRSYITRRLAWMDAELDLENTAPPVFYLPTDTVVCAGTVYDASFNGNAFSYNWQPGPDTALITLSQSGLQTLEVTDEWGCEASKQMDVTISVPDPSFTGQQSGMSLDWTFTPTDLNGSSYDWDFGDGGSSNMVSPLHSYASDGSYTVRLTMADSIGCLDSSSNAIQFVFVGTGEFAIGLEGRIFPNPFADRLEIVLGAPVKGNVEVALLNALGQVVSLETLKAGSRHIVLATSTLPKGTYFLKVKAGNQVALRKLVKAD